MKILTIFLVLFLMGCGDTITKIEQEQVEEEIVEVKQAKFIDITNNRAAWS